MSQYAASCCILVLPFAIKSPEWAASPDHISSMPGDFDFLSLPSGAICIRACRNYGQMLVELARVVPDGMVCFFVSYLYMDQIISQWNSMNVLSDIMQHKLIFIETQDVVETTLALDNFRRACDCGRGAVFFSVARGKVAEGIDFDRHYGRWVNSFKHPIIIFGIPDCHLLFHGCLCGKLIRLIGDVLRERAYHSCRCFAFAHAVSCIHGVVIVVWT
jgi:hypothetical protein